MEHADALASYVADYKQGIESDDLVVRVYNREENKLHTVPLHVLLSNLPSVVPTPTAFGQVRLSNAVHVSTCIYVCIQALMKTA